MGFFDSFLKLNKLEASEQPGWDPDLTKSEFRKFILDKMGLQLNTIKTLTPGILPVLQKPQQLLYDDPDYYIAIDTYTYTYYVCYRNLVMIDIDFHKLDVSESQSEANGDQPHENDILDGVRDYCQSHPEYRFRVFKSRNGFHLFLVSQAMNYQSDTALQLMLDLKCDFYYLLFCYWRGWSIRLNRKKADPEGQDLYQEIAPIGRGSSDPHLNKLVDLHYNLMKLFQTEDPNLMW